MHPHPNRQAVPRRHAVSRRHAASPQPPSSLKAKCSVKASCILTPTAKQSHGAMQCQGVMQPHPNRQAVPRRHAVSRRHAFSPQPHGPRQGGTPLAMGNWDVSDAAKITGFNNLASTENNPELRYCTSTSVNSSHYSIIILPIMHTTDKSSREI